MRLTGTLRRGTCLLLALIATKVAADSEGERPTYYPAYDYDSPYEATRDVEEKSGHLPLAPHYPSHGRPPAYERPDPPYKTPAPSYKSTTPSYKPSAYSPPIYKPRPEYKPEPEYHSPTPYKTPSPSYHEPAYKPKPAYQEPAYKPKPTYEEPAYKPRPAYEEPAYKPRPAYVEPAYKPRPSYEEPAYKPRPAYEQPSHPRGSEHKTYKAKSSIPGEAGIDYPIYNKIPHTKFSCDSVPYRPGMYANPEAGCQVYHVCNDDRYGLRGAEFLCTNGTIFNQETFSCDWWYNVDCDKATAFYDLNTDPVSNPYYQKPQESRENTPPASYKPEPYKAPKPTYRRPTPSYRKPEPSYHKPQPTYHAPAPKPSYQYTPKPTYHAPTPKPTYQAPTPKPSYRTPSPRPAYQTPAPSYNRPKPVYRSSTTKPSYREPSPKPTYHTPAPTYNKPTPHRTPSPASYRTPSPASYRTPSLASYRTPSPPSYRTPSPPSYRTPSPTYRPPTRRPVYQEAEPSSHPQEEPDYEFGQDFEWGTKF